MSCSCFLLTTRIDANVEDTTLNVEMAHTEILKYFQSVSSNRWLMIKIFLVLIIFFIIFVVFFAWEGTTLSVRRGGNGAKGFEGGRNRRWTCGRMCKNTNGLGCRGFLGGVLMLIESVVNSVTVSVRLPRSKGRRMMTVMLMKVELRFTVYLDREEGVLIHSVLFKLHLH